MRIGSRLREGETGSARKMVGLGAKAGFPDLSLGSRDVMRQAAQFDCAFVHVVNHSLSAGLGAHLDNRSAAF